MLVDVNELVDVVNKMVWKECYKRGVKVDEDIVQDVLLRMWRLFRKYDGKLLGTWTGYVWCVVNSVLNNLLREKYERSNVVYLNDLVREDEDEIERFLVDTRCDFSVKLFRVLAKYRELGDDFLKLVMGDIDVSNALRSVSQSRKKGIEWIEWWIGRKLSEEEVKCCEEIKALL
jgi:hypothetical protein